MTLEKKIIFKFNEITDGVVNVLQCYYTYDMKKWTILRKYTILEVTKEIFDHQ